jgi:hypothetical protein
LFWTPPGQGRQVIPAEVFSYPPRLTVNHRVQRFTPCPAPRS